MLSFTAVWEAPQAALDVRKANFYRGMDSADASGGDISASMKGVSSGP